MPDLTTSIFAEKGAAAPFVYDCFRCGTTIRISEPKSGAKYRCPLCRAKVRFKPRTIGSLNELLTAEEVQPHPALRITVIALIVAIVAVGGLGYYGYSLNQKKNEEFHRLDRLASANIVEARRQARTYSFEAAGATLGQAESEVAQSTLLSSQSRELFQDRLAVALAELKVEEAEFRRRLKEGYHVVGGRLLGPDDAELALAEERQQDEAERSRREAESHARAEAEEKERVLREAEQRAEEERARRQREQETAQRDLAESLRILPPIEDVLGGLEYTLQRMKMTSALLSKRLAEVDPNKPYDAAEFVLSTQEVRRRLLQTEAPILTGFRDELSDLVANLNFDNYLLSDNESRLDAVPIIFARVPAGPVVMIGIAFSDSVYSAVDPEHDAPPKRAAAFIRSVILNSLRGKPGPGRMPGAVPYIAITGGYAIRNFARRDEIPEAEFICVVMRTTEIAAFARGDLSEGDLLRNSAALVATRDELFTEIELPRD